MGDAGGQKEECEECFHDVEMMMFANHGAFSAVVGTCSTGWLKLSQLRWKDGPGRAISGPWDGRVFDADGNSLAGLERDWERVACCD